MESSACQQHPLLRLRFHINHVSIPALIAVVRNISSSPPCFGGFCASNRRRRGVHDVQSAEDRHIVLTEGASPYVHVHVRGIQYRPRSHATGAAATLTGTRASSSILPPRFPLPTYFPNNHDDRPLKDPPTAHSERTMVSLVDVLTVLGGILALPYLYRFSAFVWLYFLRPSTVHHYLHGSAPYALVTGATDGIGKGTAAELFARGFNLVLHGRNEAKMLAVIAELRAQARRPDGEGDIRYFLADAAKPGHDFEKMIAPFKDLNITLVLHNVGGSNGVQPERLDERPEAYIHTLVHWNALFPLLLTRVLLPQLRRSATHGPVLVQFVGSLAGDVSPPRLPIYAASKRFLEGLVRGLDNDEQFFDKPTGVRFTYLAVGPVNSASMPQAPSLMTPTSEAFGKAVVNRTGCGRRRVAPYWFHAVSQVFVEALGQGTVDGFTAQEMKGLIDTYAKQQ